MADVKVTGLSAITPPLNNGSLFLTSSYDGVSAYTSEKLTLTQLRDEVFLMEAEDKLTFDSSGTNKVFAEDSNSTAKIKFDKDYIGGDGIYIDIAGDSSDTETYAAYGDDALGFYVGYGFEQSNGAEFGYDPVTKRFQFLYYSGAGVANAANMISMADNSAGSSGPYGSGSSYTVFVGGKNLSSNIGITDAVVVAGNGINADKNDYLFSGKHEMQLATETFSFEDAGSVSATEQDWIEVSVGGVTGYIRVFATK